jgi:hypothetical protein
VAHCRAAAGTRPPSGPAVRAAVFMPPALAAALVAPPQGPQQEPLLGPMRPA